jgi:hypothetical protein
MRVENRNSHLPPAILSEATKKLSSVLDNQRPLSGLSFAEEKEYLPHIIGVSPDHREFGEKVQQFWAEKSHKIPSGGLRLEVGENNGEPINLNDWITFQWAQKHPLVADSKEEAESDPNKDYWIHDPERVEKKENQKVQLRTQAYTEFAKMKEDEDKMDLMIRVLTQQRPEKMTDAQKENQLDTVLSNDPKKFIKTAQDEDLEHQAEILQMLEHEILRKVGNQIMYMDEVIGATMEEAVAWFKNKRNSSDVNTLRAKLEEAKR